jgi:hypothetical protein
MDPAGKESTSYARYLALAGLLLSLGSMILLALFGLGTLWREWRTAGG